MISKYNLNRLRRGMREKWKQTLAEEIVRHREKIKGMRGIVVMHSMADELESVVLTFWDTKEDMDAFNSPGNDIVASFLERARPFMEGAPERSDYSVEELVMQ